MSVRWAVVDDKDRGCITRDQRLEHPHGCRVGRMAQIRVNRMRGEQGSHIPDRLEKRLHDAALANSGKPDHAHGTCSITDKVSGRIECVRETSDRLAAPNVEGETLLANQLVGFSFGC